MTKKIIFYENIKVLDAFLESATSEKWPMSTIARTDSSQYHLNVTC